MSKTYCFFFLLILFVNSCLSQFGGQCLQVDSSLCYNLEPFPPVTFSIEQKYQSQASTTIYHSPLLADVNGDCIPDLIMPATTNFINGTDANSGIRLTSGIVVVNTANGQTITTIPTAMYAWTVASSIIIGDFTNDGNVEFIIAAADHTSNLLNHRARLICYNLAGSILWVSDEQYGSNALYRYGGSLASADFNQDGIPEVYIYNEIFNAQTGVKLCSGGNNGIGKQLEAPLFGTVSISIAGQFDDDPNDLELAAGYSCYKVNIINTAGSVGNTMTPMNIQVGGQFKDGYTSFADINQDGKLDIIVSSPANTSQIGLYVYNIIGNTAVLIASTTLPSGGGGMPNEIGPAFVGDIDGSGVPSIGVCRPYRLLTYKYNGTTALELFWQINTNDISGQTGMTMFDFNQDGVQEIVYRDETTLRIINGSINPPVNIATFPCFSGTGVEHPIVGDIDNTGEAKICVPCGTSNTGLNSFIGNLAVFGSSGDFWSPARSIWNQYQYHVTNVNDDLTIPQFQLNNASYANGSINNFYVQSSWLNESGEYLWGVVDIVAEIDCIEYIPSSGDYQIDLLIGNSSSASLSNEQPFYVMVFNGDPSQGGILLETILISDVLQSGQFLDNLSITVSEDLIISDELFIVGNIDPNYQLGQPLDSTAFVLDECGFSNNIFVAYVPTITFVSDTICQGESVEYLGQEFDQAGTYFLAIQNQNGCDSMYLDLEIILFQNQIFDTLDVESCGSYNWFGQTYSVSGQYEYLLPGVACDDTLFVLNLEISQPINQVELISCDSIYFQGSWIYESTFITDVYDLPNLFCDSIVETTIIIANSTYESIEISACDSYSFQGITYTNSGVYELVSVNQAGCSHYTELNLELSQSIVTVSDTTVCGSFIWNGNQIVQSGFYQETFSTTSGCDSTVQLNITVLPVHYIEQIRYTCDPNDIAPEYFYFTNSFGCDSTVVIQPIPLPDSLRPVANFIINPNPIDISALSNLTLINLSSNFDSCEWSIPSIPFNSNLFSPNGINITDIGNYEITLTVVNELGCIDQLTLTLYVGEEFVLYVPNTFTPDGDPHNNIFIPVFSGNFDIYNYELLIFNRWGELIFESYHPLIGWDGTYLGKRVPDGTYVWKMKYRASGQANRNEIIGHVNVLR